MPWISVAEARRRLNGAVSAQLLYRMLGRGELEGTKIGGKVLIDADSLDEMIGLGRVALVVGHNRQGKAGRPARSK